MINLTQKIKMIAIEYRPQCPSISQRHYNPDCFEKKTSLSKVYLNKYAKKDYRSPLHPFKIVEC